MNPEIDENPESRSHFLHVVIPCTLANRLAGFQFLRRKAVGLSTPEVEFGVFSYAGHTLYAVSYYEGSKPQRDRKVEWFESAEMAEGFYEGHAATARERMKARGEGDPFQKMVAVFNLRHSCLLVPSKVMTLEEHGIDQTVVDIHLAEVGNGILVVFTTSCGFPPIEPVAKILPYSVQRGVFSDYWGFTDPEGEHVSADEVVRGIGGYCESQAETLGALVDAAMIAEKEREDNA